MRFYLSHPIRGSKGDKATAVDMKQNNDRAIEIANYIRDSITLEIEVYVPAEHEEFVLRTLKFNYLTIDQILAIDCSIIDTCDAVLIYSPDGNIVSGCKVEHDHAIKNDIPVCVFKDVTDVITWVSEFILRV